MSAFELESNPTSKMPSNIERFLEKPASLSALNEKVL